MKLAKWDLLIALLGAALLTGVCLAIGVTAAPFAADKTKAYWLVAAGDAAKLLTFTLGVPAAVLALFNHRRGLDQQAAASLWKKREFVAKAVAELEADPRNRFAMSILDYNSRRLMLPGTKVLERFDEDDIILALAPREIRGRYKLTETAIRDCFDSFFNALDRLGVMRRAELIDWADLEPYVGYWLVLLDREPRERSEAFGAAIRLYVEWFHFEALAELLAFAGVATDLDGTEEEVIAAQVDAIQAQRLPKAPTQLRSRTPRAPKPATNRPPAARRGRSAKRRPGPEEEDEETEEE